MTSPSKTFCRFIGCDVGKSNIVVHDSASNVTCSIANQPGPLASFMAGLDADCLIICEATGGYEAALLAAAVKASIPAHRADARKVKAFIRSFGILGKSDTIDARALARYGSERHTQLALWSAPEPQREQLQAMVLTRRDLITQSVAFTNRLAAPGGAAVHTYLKKLLDCLQKQITALDVAIAALIQAHQPLARAAKTLRAMTGIGPQSSAALIALMPELGHIDRRKAAALAGLAPHPRQSGGHDGYRRTRGGRPEIKRALFMAALVAVRHNERLRDFYERLIKSGKKKLVALTAVMRKMIVILNAKMRDAYQTA